MLLWVVFATIAAGLLAAALAPLIRGGAPEAGRKTARDVYADQLREIAAEEAAGRLGRPEAEAARAEIGRRLLAAEETAGALRSGRPARVLALVSTIGAVALVLGTYLTIGSAHLPDRPLFARGEELRQAAEDAARRAEFERLVGEVEKRLAEQPRDVEGWALLIGAYERLERWRDLAAAYDRLIGLMPQGPQTALLLSGKGEALVLAAEGQVTPAAVEVFQAALAIAPGDGTARYYLALERVQVGDRAGARAAFQTLLADETLAPGQRALVERQLQDLGPAS